MSEKSAPETAEFDVQWSRAAPALLAWSLLHLRAPVRARIDPEDLLQEVACRALERFASFDPARADFRAWIFGIARNVLYQSLERLAASAPGSGRRELSSSSWLSVPDSTTLISRRVARDEALTRLIAELDALDEHDRRLVLYRGLEGLSHDEVARLLDVAPDAAAKRWQRLRDRLRDRVDTLGLAAD